MNAASDRIARALPVFYGYLMVPIAMLMQIGTSPGQTFAISAFTPALLDSLNVSQSRLGLAYMLGTVLAAIPLSAVGPAADRFGLKRLSLIVVMGLALACWLMSLVAGFWGLLGGFFLLRFLGQGSLTLLASNTTGMWFRDQIGRVSAVLSVGSAIAFAWIPGVIAETIDTHGWRWTYRLIGCLLVGGLLPLIALLYRNRPEDVGQRLDGMEHREGDPDVRAKEDAARSVTLARAARTVSYYIIGLSNIIWAMAGTGILFYLFMLCEERGLDETTPKSLFKYLGFSMLAAQLGGGIAADFYRLNRLFGIGTTVIAASLAWLYLDTTLTGARAFAMLFGAGQGLLISVSGVTIVRYYGREHLGSIRGAIWCGTVAGSGCGPFLMGGIQDLYGSYDAAILVFAAAMVPLGVAAWFIRPPNEPAAD